MVELEGSNCWNGVTCLRVHRLLFFHPFEFYLGRLVRGLSDVENYTDDITEVDVSDYDLCKVWKYSFHNLYLDQLMGEFGKVFHQYFKLHAWSHLRSSVRAVQLVSFL